MKKKLCLISYGIFELFIGAIAVKIGIPMIIYPDSYPFEYPTEWLTKVPFTNWFIPGIIAVLVYGLFNIISAVIIIAKKQRNSVVFGIAMGCTLLVSIIVQIIILGSFLISVECLFVSIIQIIYGVYILRKFN